jgi:CheY-like chemotaxis protein
MSTIELPSAWGTILLIEDDRQQAAFVSLILHECNLVQHIEVVPDGQEALEFFVRLEAPQTSAVERRLPSAPQLIILDLELPYYHGLKVLQHIKSHPTTKHIPVIVLTGSYIASDLKKSYDLGTMSFLRKPIDPEILIRAVEHCLTPR